jgi:hypothetical protein
MPLYYKIYFGYYGTLLLACALTGCLLVRKNWPFWSWLLVVLSCMTFLAEAIAFVFASFTRINHLGWYNAWIFLETMALLYILSREAVLPSMKRLHRGLLIALPLGTLFCYIGYPAFDRNNEYAMLLYLFLELAAVCAVLADTLRDESDKPVSGKPIFWLAIGMLFYCSLFIVAFSVGKFLDKLNYPYFIPFSYAANTFMYGGYIACFIALSRQGSKVLQE